MGEKISNQLPPWGCFKLLSFIFKPENVKKNMS